MNRLVRQAEEAVQHIQPVGGDWSAAETHASFMVSKQNNISCR